MKKVIVMVLSMAAVFCGWSATETVDGKRYEHAEVLRQCA